MALKHVSSLVKQRRSHAYLSTNPEADTCVVFVHGFFGDPIGTWGQFSDLCDSDELKGRGIWARSDLYFYDYGAEHDFVKRSASGLGHFLERLFPQAQTLLLGLSHAESLKIRNPWLAYSRLILVGHSLGAVVIRECLENKLRDSSGTDGIPAWVSACELRLFAAAHRPQSRE